MHYNNEYFERTSKLDMTKNYNYFLQYFQGQTILDLGCGSGRDSNYFKRLKYDVTSIDNSPYAKAFASSKYNIDVDLVDIERGVDGVFDGIWACASLVHIDHHSILQILEQLQMNLNPGGLIYISLKYGKGKIVSNGQTYYLYDEAIVDEIRNLGYKLCDLKITSNENPMNSWIEVIIQNG